MALWIASDECELDETDMDNVASLSAVGVVNGLGTAQPHDCASLGQGNR
jgi:hypothetical protein